MQRLCAGSLVAAVAVKVAFSANVKENERRGSRSGREGASRKAKTERERESEANNAAAGQPIKGVPLAKLIYILFARWLVPRRKSLIVLVVRGSLCMLPVRAQWASGALPVVAVGSAAATTAVCQPSTSQ